MDIERFLSSIKNYDSRVIVAIGPHSPYACSEDLLLKCKEIADRENLYLTIHLAETLDEQTKFEERYGKREVEYLDDIGFLSSNVLAVHCVWLTKNEIRLLGKNGVKVVHCPTSNLKLGVGGVFPLSEFLRNGIPIGLGTDGAASNNSLSLFETMKHCALLHKYNAWDPTVAPAQMVFDFATVGGASALGLKNLSGSIAKGMPADLVLLDRHSPNLMPIISDGSIISHLVYSASGFNVSDVIVDGEVIYSDGRFMKVDAAKVYSEVEAAVSRLFS